MRDGKGVRLRLARQARGYSQQQLAGMAGVSRQAVSAVESGLSDPSLRVALALARALGMTAEEIFGSAGPAARVVVRPFAPLGGEGARVTLAPTGDGFVAMPLSGATVSRAGFLPAGGLAAGPDRADSGCAGEQVRPVGPPRALVPAACDLRRQPGVAVRVGGVQEPGAELGDDAAACRAELSAEVFGYGTGERGGLAQLPVPGRRPLRMRSTMAPASRRARAVSGAWPR